MDDMDTPVEPESEDIPPAAQEADQVEVEQSQEAQDSDESQGDEAEVEYVEVERDGKTYTIPADLKGEFMMDRDYRHKTMSLADDRKAFQAQVEQFQSTQKEHETFVQEQVELHAINKRLDEWAQVDWDTWESTSPADAAKAFRQYQLDRNTADDLKSALDEKVRTQQAEASKKQRLAMERGAAEVAKIPGWSDTKASELTQFAVKEFDFTEDQVKVMRHDPRIARLVQAAHVGMAKLKSIEKPKADPIKPAPKLKGGGSTTKLDLVKDADKMSADDWVKQREAELRRSA